MDLSKITVHWIQRTDSTQRLANHAAERGVRSGVWVADEQTQGRGRLRNEGVRTWQSPPRAGLWFSTLLTPRVPPERVSAITLLLALACADALREHTALDIALKWPNDLFVRGRKLGGILTQGALLGDDLVVIAGIGINLDLDPATLPQEVSELATSVLRETGQRTDRLTLLTSILRNISKELQTFEHTQGLLCASTIARWETQSRDLGLDAHTPHAPDTTLHIVGLDASGGLRTTLPNGQPHTHTSGELIWHTPPTS